ncbi:MULTISPECIES: tripartite tricarboxylate transporter substrate binding protein [Salinicoccus]|uniref:Tricarboxylic transport TctC n=1 Tax=Salinicoccus roseus TaxID=45670 RepID=A0A265E7I8_9STAP|nr:MULTISPECIES: tripartite tricarboxylate transporter substrate-binding protein [Salinicoccus]OZT77480.1 tricarboxylic transport TctC [Salinicoccus roseus]
MKKFLSLLLLAVVALFAVACSGEGGSEESAEGESADSGEGSGGEESAESWEPSEPIEIVAPAGAGGGYDTTARMAMQTFSEEGIIEEDMGVTNKVGGGGAVGWSYIADQAGSNHHLFVTSPPFLLVPLNGQSEYNYEDFTPIANMIADYPAFAVAEDAEWNDLNELFEDMKEDPASVTVVGTSSPGSMDHIAFAYVAKAAGVDITQIKYVSAQDGEGVTQILNGSADVFSTGIAETAEQARAGNMRVLGVTSEERLEGETLGQFPTVKEQGIDAELVNWRGFFGPPDMDQAAVDYYVEKFEELSNSEGFADVRAQFGWNEMYMAPEEYQEYLDAQNEEFQSILDELGLGQSE